MGPLKNVKVIEFAGLGPGPFCAMLLSDLGADVIRIDRNGGIPGAPSCSFDLYNAGVYGTLNRGRRSIALDIKKPEAVAAVLRLIEKADALIEGYRPGVMERLGLGPEVCLAHNPSLVYGRMTGWGQTGPLAHSAGHDLNYIALSGALHSIGTCDGAPAVPPALVGDMGGGGMLLALGLVSALLETRSSGQGQVVDAAVTEGASLLITMLHGLRAASAWSDKRGANILDGAAPFYGVYECSDGKYVAVGAIEPHFYRQLLELCGVDDPGLQEQMAVHRWSEQRRVLAEVFRAKPRHHWCSLLEGSDACFAPVLDLGEAAEHPHNRRRNSFVEVGGIRQPAPAPRFSRTPAEVQGPPPEVGQDTEQILAEFGFSPADIEALQQDGVVSIGSR